MFAIANPGLGVGTPSLAAPGNSERYSVVGFADFFAPLMAGRSPGLYGFGVDLRLFRGLIGHQPNMARGPLGN